MHYYYGHLTHRPMKRNYSDPLPKSIEFHSNLCLNSRLYTEVSFLHQQILPLSCLGLPEKLLIANSMTMRHKRIAISAATLSSEDSVWRKFGEQFPSLYLHKEHKMGYVPIRSFLTVIWLTHTQIRIQRVWPITRILNSCTWHSVHREQGKQQISFTVVILEQSGVYWCYQDLLYFYFLSPRRPFGNDIWRRISSRGITGVVNQGAISWLTSGNCQ